MNKINFLFTLLVLAVLFMGCPYSSEIAIDEPKVKIDNDLLKKWELRSSSDYSYTISKNDDYTYKIEKVSKTSGDKTTYLGFVSDIKGTKFFNIWEDGSTTKTYYFYKLEKESATMIKLVPVTENIDEKFDNSTSLKDFFAKNMGLSFFFDKDEESYIAVQ